MTRQSASIERRRIVLIVWLSVAWGLTFTTVGTLDPRVTDFHSFYRSGLALRGIESPPDVTARPDLNTPVLAALVAPLTRVSLQSAFWIWTIVGMAALAAALWRIYRARSVPAERMLWIVGTCGVLAPFHAVWIQGQVTWLLLYPITMAWLAADRPWVAGAWLGPAIAIKPPLALAAALLPMPIPIAAALSSVAIAAADVALGGRGPWRAWADRLARVDWLPNQWNASLWGIATRVPSVPLWGTARLGDTPFAVIFAVLVVIAWMALQVMRRSGDRRWTLALLWSTVASPLGWIYYLPLALGPLAVVWRATPAFLICAALFLLPVSFLSLAATRVIAPGFVGSLSAFTLLFAWLLLIRERDAGQ